MGKLNYTARKISGIKAAQVVSKDLKKRIPPGIGSKAAARDPHVEIDVAGKDLTDEGFELFIDDLFACIKYRDDAHTDGLARVTELHLQKNQLTVQSLAKLGEVVSLSAGDLREIDLSQNNIRIHTSKEKDIWRDFLDSFKDCYVLKKLDLGGNPLGSAGAEILARVYIKSDLDFLENDADAIIGSKADEEAVVVERVSSLKISSGQENEAPRCRARKVVGKAKNGHSHTALTVAELKHFACTRGLRSIPFLIVSGISMTNSSAVHLASMLTIQRAQEHLLDFLPGGKTVALPDTATECKSIIWKPNDRLSAPAKRLLEVAETIGNLKFDSVSEEDGMDHDSFDDHNEETDSIAQRKLQKKMDVEHTRLTKRVRMEALKVEGLHCMDLWMTSLKMMLVSRALLLEDTDRAINSPSEESVNGEHTEDSKDSVENNVDEYVKDYVESQQIPEIVVEQIAGPYQCIQTPYVGPFQPGTEIFEENFPALQVHIPEKTANGDNKYVPNGDKGTNASSMSPPKDTPKAVKGSVRFSNGNKPFQKMQWRFGLPFELWRRVIADAVGADGILDLEQQMRIMRYASDWNSVSYEMTITGAEDHQQIWKFLETVNCFTYSPL
ncbi:hypothetical protein BDV59DRAFT_202440 [Aspergillus ambiguus]|uniref:uncharacterized protein n=1 Tax=Aspergillus ambiguus TaxID=176160 RepID=UPI003CCD2801